MEKAFFQKIWEKQQRMDIVPPNEEIAGWANDLICLLYPEHSRCLFRSLQEIEENFYRLKDRLIHILNATQACHKKDNLDIAEAFFAQVPALYETLNTDVEAIVMGDPAAKSHFEVIRAYPGFQAIAFYRIAHALLKLDVPLIPRILTEHAHSQTGIDIHPGAEIDEYFFIDHGTGIVIGETARIGKYVKLYQGATLGALSVDKSMASMKRHPTVEDHVVIYSGATILGGETVIGHHSIIGGNVWLTRSVPPGSIVYHTPEITVEEGTIQL
ncbi:serine O-acetyltransferase EpsC [Thermoflavifilum thermophilum]|uniref:Serine acetyltransferase n=1 Tax=Thermoflavifilum thermophilum TaxID=1393122 RepID=A0A1I7N3S9_9BACT|nr:serine O-acetyltransferase EpsC [Thermoflavifilum thermophilum]SFV29243.1 serine O-acetyltransferase [Thermoflavifilum thermophilum]